MSGYERELAANRTYVNQMALNFQDSPKLSKYARLAQRLKLMPRTPQVLLAVGVAAAGWKIGGSIRELFFEQKQPEPAFAPTVYTQTRMVEVTGEHAWGGRMGWWDGATCCPQTVFKQEPGYLIEAWDGASWHQGHTEGSRSQRAADLGGPSDADCYPHGAAYRNLLDVFGSQVTPYTHERHTDFWCQGAALYASPESTAVTKVEPYTGQTIAGSIGQTGSPPAISDASIDEWIEDPDNADAAEEINDWLGAPAIGSFELPAPEAHETYDAYIGRLQALGHVGTTTKVELSTDTLDPAREAGEVVRTTPAQGTVIAPDTAVTVRVNPADAPPATATTPGLPSSGSGCTPWTSPAINLAPLNVELPDTFPFGVPFWVKDALDNWVGTAEIPEWEFHFPYGGDFTVSLEMFDPHMPAIRAVLLVVSILSLAWLFMSAALGFGAGRKDD